MSGIVLGIERVCGSTGAGMTLVQAFTGRVSCHAFWCAFVDLVTQVLSFNDFLGDFQGGGLTCSGGVTCLVHLHSVRVFGCTTCLQRHCQGGVYHNGMGVRWRGALRPLEFRHCMWHKLLSSSSAIKAICTTFGYDNSISMRCCL
jgi:hypothetical protein